MSEEKLYSAPAVQVPTVDKLRHSAERTGLDLTDQQLQEYAELIGEHIPAYTRVDNLPEPTLPVKYPRTPGYRPGPEENEYNAWYWRTDIKGASSGILTDKKVAIKDNVAVAGVPMMNGSRVLEGYVPEFDATIITRILDAGGNIIGKAACEDLCFSSASFTTCKGTVLNPVNKAYDAGGSSCGSAVLVACGDADMAIGGDQGGSVRIPASRCGIVGLKPTYGLVPYTGACGIEPVIDHLGPMAKSVADVALLLEAIAGCDGYDFRQSSLLAVGGKYSQQLNGTIKGLKVGMLKEGFSQSGDEVCGVVRKAVDKFKNLGVTVEEVSIPQHVDAYACWAPPTFDGLWNSMVRGCGTGVGHKGFYPTSMAEHMRRGYKTVANDLSTTVKMFMLFGDYIESNYGQKFYHKAMNLQPVIKKAYDDALEEYDALVMPTLTTKTKTLPCQEDVESEKGYASKALGGIENTAPFNYTGHPAITLNAGSSAEGLPVGIQLVGKMFDEAQLLNVAYALEQELMK